MNSEKIDTTLNLSLETDVNIRQKSEVLSVGVNETEGTWEVVVKYHGDISEALESVMGVDILVNGYAIMVVTKEQLEHIVRYEQIEYVELPKSMQFNVYREKEISCILPLTVSGPKLNGTGVLIGIIDSGIDYLLRDFQNENGSRILYLWDQGLQGEEGLPSGFSKGVEYTKAEIDRAIFAANENGVGVNRQRAYEVVSSVDVTGHGTAVAGIAAGNSVSPLYQGVALGCELIIVKLDENDMQNGSENFALTTDLMRGISYVVRKAQKLGQPLVINLSIGSTYGAHDGTSLLERFIDSVCENGRNVICIGTGNEAVSNGHTSFQLRERVRIELAIDSRETGTNVQIWKNYVDDFEVEVEAPDGSRYKVELTQREKQSWRVGKTEVLVYVSTPKPFSVNEEIFFDFVPLEEYIDGGIWAFIISPIGNNQHDYHMYLPGSNGRNAGTRFVMPTPDLTMTIPAFASRALTVGAYDTITDGYADFSGRDRNIGEEERVFFASNVKPDIAAPGVNILAPAAGGGYAAFTGTSFAAPIVTGSVALLMEWGIVRGNDIYLYGEKVKAYLRKGAKPLGSDVAYPNSKTGWGALCVMDSIDF